MAAGLGRALRWGGWRQLELAVSGMGQPRPLLTEATPQPPASAWAPAPNTVTYILNFTKSS